MIRLHIRAFLAVLSIAPCGIRGRGASIAADEASSRNETNGDQRDASEDGLKEAPKDIEKFQRGSQIADARAYRGQNLR